MKQQIISSLLFQNNRIIVTDIIKGRGTLGS